MSQKYRHIFAIFAHTVSILEAVLQGEYVRLFVRKTREGITSILPSVS